MRLITGHNVLKEERPKAVTLGKFDGLHLGHQKLIREVLAAKKEGLEAAAFTFARPPRELTGTPEAPVLLTNREKRIFMEQAGIELLVEYPFDASVLRMEAEDFLKNVLMDGLKVKKIVTGPDFCFGFKRKGNVSFLKQKAEEYGYELIVLEKERAADGTIISSSLIREELAAGNIERTNELLGYPFTITGKVVHGNHLGRTFGMPTINQIPEQEKLLPPNGVYTSMVNVDDVWYQAVSNVGYKPTIEGNYPKGVETFIFGFDRDVYGRTLDVRLLHFQRPEQKFSTIDELTAQLQRDSKNSLAYFAEHPQIIF